MTAKKQKPAKKAATPKPKLIEGKYAEKFLCRLLPEESEQLEKLLSITGQKTKASAVRIAIMNYERITAELARITGELHLAKANTAHYRRSLETYFKALDDLLKIKPLKNIQQRMFDEEGEL